MMSSQAIDFKPPLASEGTYSSRLKARVEAAGTIRRRGGVERFGRLEGETELAMIDLIWHVKRVITQKNYLQGGDLRKFKIGFIELIHQPPGSVIEPHCDGYNDCDFAANYVFHGSADCTVQGKRFRLNAGDVYIFRPHQQLHGVDAPINNLHGRYVVSIRFFLVD